MTTRHVIIGALRDWLFDAGDNRVNLVCSRAALVVLAVAAIVSVPVVLVLAFGG